MRLTCSYLSGFPPGHGHSGMLILEFMISGSESASETFIYRYNTPNITLGELPVRGYDDMDMSLALWGHVSHASHAISARGRSECTDDHCIGLRHRLIVNPGCVGIS